MISAYFAVRDRLLEHQPVHNTLGQFRARLMRGAQCVVFKSDQRGGQFLGVTRVIELTERTEGNRTIQLAEFEEVEDFDTPRVFTAIAGSLERIRYVLEPQRHFRRSILKISGRDFATISENRVDVRKSVFRYMFASLPMEMQMAFLQQQGVDLDKFYTGAMQWMEGLDTPLSVFFTQSLVPRLDLIRSVARTHDRLNVSGVPSIAELNMTDGHGENHIWLGRLSQGVARLLDENALFTEVRDRPRLLDEIGRQTAG